MSIAALLDASFHAPFDNAFDNPKQFVKSTLDLESQRTKTHILEKEKKK